MRTSLVILVAAVSLVVFAGAQSRQRTTLDIYVVDVEGGNATLFVAPSGESVLIDSGNGGAAATRDADRIMAAAKDAGLTQIDALITTHWHGDHFGGMNELASRIPIRHFIDHGPNIERAAAADEFLQTTYPALFAKARRTIAKPGDKVSISGVEWRIVSSAGKAITTPLPGEKGAGRPNPYCASFTRQTVNPVSGQPSANTEDTQSVGSSIIFGKFRTLHLGDLGWNQEFDLMCPTNRIGTLDLLVVSRHGQPSSNSELLVHALQPRVGVMNNGTRKGGQPDAMRVLYSSPGLEDLWQIHFSLLSGQEYTAPGIFIANMFDEPQASMPLAALTLPPGATGVPPPPQHNGPAYWIKVSARTDGTFTVTNSRNGFSKIYQ
jgi:beta-lactamase superfamily II metal-dependent hydrolase